MAKNKSDEPVTFTYFADASPPTLAEPGILAATEVSEEEQIQENVKVFLEKRAASPWLKERYRAAHGPIFLASPAKEDL